MNWYEGMATAIASSSSNDSSPLERGLEDIVELGLEPGGRATMPVVSPWKKPGRGRGKRRGPLPDLSRFPASEDASLPTGASGNSPDGMGRT